MGIKEDVLKYLKDRTVLLGETVEYGWFIFRIKDVTTEVEIESPDFKTMASFCDDFNTVEKLHEGQQGLLAEVGETPEWCNLQQYAVVSKSYSSGISNAFLHRASPRDGNDSGWYVGVADDVHNVNDPENLMFVSLYELSINDQRFTSFWLLPQDYYVLYDGEDAEMRKQ